MTMENMKKIRKAKNITQEALGEMTAIDQAFISKIEAGIGNPTLEVITAIASALNVEPAELFTLSEVKRRTLAAVEAIGDPDQQAAAILVLESMARPRQML